MSVVLVRVDDRLIHGQVSIGWAAHLKPTLILVLDDDVAAEAWENELVCSACPESLRAEVTTVAEGARRLAADAAAAGGGPRMLVLLRGTSEALRMVDAGYRPAELNIGGLHHHPGSRSVLPYVYVDGAEEADLRALAERGIRLSAQDLPGNRAYDLLRLLNEAPGAAPTGGST
jgi:mannose/fructose/N-acetylgalactosamine-specific phosphotransferase system component IIB